MLDILDELNKEQKEAVVYNDGPLLVLAGAGTGKTKVLTSKIAYLLETGQVFPSEILAVTFTNKASREMQERVANMLKKDISNMWMGTFHSIANKILRKHAELVDLTDDFTIIDPDDQNRLIKQILGDFDIDIKEYPVKNYTNKINEWKDKGITYENSLNFGVDFNYYPEITEIYKEYQARCKSLNVCDFGDLLLYNVEIFKKYPEILKKYIDKFEYILVDEYQDTNAIQHTWLKMIAGIGVKENIHITCVGDDDQSIYGWRGAEIENILKFEKEFKNTKIVRLERNYRSTSNILNVASAVISHNKDRHKKTLWTDNKNCGEKVCLNCFDREDEEIYSIASEITELNKKIQYKDMAILIRAGYQTRSFEKIFLSQSIPYKIVGGLKFYDRKEIKDCIAYLKLVKNHSDFLAFERIINIPRRGVGSVTLKKILAEVKCQNTNVLDVCEELCKAGTIKGKTADNIMQFVKNIRNWSNQLTEKDHITLTKDIIYGSGYIDNLSSEKTDESKNAIENINEFIRGLSEFQSLSDFLEYVSLASDKSNTQNEDSVNIMTIHSAKGLEFDTVFLPGWEEGIFPSPRSIDEKNGLEEERRLAYVAITRAKNRLTISYSKTRSEYQELKIMQPSRFVKELPEENLQITNEITFVEDDYSEESDEEYENKRVGRYNNYYTPKWYNNSKKYDIDDNSERIIQRNTENQVKNIAKMVVHPTFGEGVVIKSEGKKLTIAFKSCGLKTIIKDFVKFI